jgi:hypothetical protein
VIRPEGLVLPNGDIVMGWSGQTGEYSGYTVVNDPAPEPTLAEAKAVKLEAVNAERDRRRYPGPVDTGLGWGIDFRDEIDERNVAGLVMAALALLAQGVADPVIPVRGADDVTRMLTPAEMVSAGRAPQQRISAVYQASWTIKAAIEAAADLPALEAVDITSAWPS